MNPDQSLEIVLTGPLASSVRTLLQERYDGLTAADVDGAAVLRFDRLDQAGERAVLTLLWDTGHEVRSAVRPG